jgi:subtilase family serine protease
MPPTPEKRFRASPSRRSPVPQATFPLQLERLEERTLPAATNPAAAALASGPSGPFTPAQIQQTYGFNQITFDNGTVQGNGSGQTIAIVVANSDPNISSDLQAFDAQFGLSNPNLTVKSYSGDGQTVGVDPTGDWERETALDVEWAHAMAPGASILLVEASSPGQIFNAAQYAAGQPGVSVVSLSVMGPETAFESATDSDFTTPAGHQGVTFVAAAGDDGTVSYPAASPNVLAVGGTTLTLTASGNYGSETPWSDSGGGVSQFESEPSYQEGVQITGKRTTPDVAYDANPGTGFWVYDSYNDGGDPWQVVGGTSAGTPQWAALIAIADQGRALEGLPSLNGATQTLPMLYQTSSAAFHPVSGASPSPSGNYNQTTGLGSPYANRVVAGLAQEVLGSGQTVTATAGQSFTGTVATFTDYTGTGSLSALINWGDGQTSQGQVVSEGNGQYQVVGTHTYAAAGTYTMQVQIEGSNVVTSTVASSAQVASSPQPSASPSPLSTASASPSPTPQPTISPPATQPTARAGSTPQASGAATSNPQKPASSNPLDQLLDALFLMEGFLSNDSSLILVAQMLLSSHGW